MKACRGSNPLPGESSTRIVKGKFPTKTEFTRMKKSNLGFLFVFPLFAFLMFSLILSEPVFAVNHEDPENGRMGGKLIGPHHIPHNGVCAPGFAVLDKICVLDDRCGPGAYPGKVCIMDGIMKEYLRPLHQKHAGISADNIICAEGKQLLFKSHNAFPACVDSNSVEKLEKRGWQLEKPPIACTLEYDPVCGMDEVTYGNKCALNAEHIAMKHEGECLMKIITNFDECVAAGNPVMESYPQQCRSADGQLFIEDISIQELKRDSSETQNP